MELYPGTYWHWADPNSNIFHNAFLGKGFCLSTSVMAHGELAEATTPYAFFNREQEKELLFEEIRRGHYRDRPTRLKSFYCFRSKLDADRARTEWFSGQDKELIEVQITRSSQVHVGDSKFLDGERDHWQSNAHHYWRGEATDNSLLEIIVHGVVYFPGWQGSPFGLFTS